MSPENVLWLCMTYETFRVEGLRFRVYSSQRTTSIELLYSIIYTLLIRSDWGGLHFDKVWPDWKSGIKGEMTGQVENIGMYYSLYTQS
jgi:hypothetical protein